MTQSSYVRAGLAALAIAAAAGEFADRVHAQQADPKEPLVFEVAAIKPTPAGDKRQAIIFQPPGGQSYQAVRIPFRTILTIAYQVTDRQISGGPDWVNTDPWNIDAKANRRGTSDELHDALARLIEERFHLKIRHEKRNLPCYLLTVDKKGSKMPEHDESDLEHPPFGGGRGADGLPALSGKNVTMNYFAFFLSRIMDRNVVDQTGLTKHYDVDVHFRPELPQGRVNGEAPPNLPDGPDIYTAVREQLGLKLEKGTGPVDFLVIEHVEKATEN